MKQPVFTGSAAALVTPYDENGVDYGLLDRIIDRHAGSGTAALVVCATTGEAPVLTESERHLIISFCVRRTAGKMKVIAGIGGNDTEKAAVAAREAEILGADGVMLTAPYYNKASRSGLFRHFAFVAEHTGLPLIVYNVPGRTSVSCSADLYSRLAEIENINGIKEASGDVSLVSETRRLCGGDMHIWSGNDDQTLPIMALGGEGVISVAANVIPDGMTKLCRTCLEGDFIQARLLHERYALLFKLLFSDVNPIPVKAALHLMGLDHGQYRMPLCPMEEEPLQQLEACMRELSIIS